MSDTPGAPPPFQPQPYQTPTKMPSGATLALILSILGIIACQVLGPVGWYLGQKELDLIDAGVNDPNKRDQANAAKIVGIIGTVILGVMLLAAIAIIVIILIAAGSGA